MKLEWDLSGQIAVVTGGAMGIGRCIAETLGSSGSAIVLCDRDIDAGEAAARELQKCGFRCFFVQNDVTDPSSVKNAVEMTLGKMGGLHILINNAGISRGTPLEDIDAEEWDLLMGVNLKGPFLWTKAAVATMKAQRYGRIVNMSSIAAIAGGGFVGTAHYAASKAGLIALTKAAAKTFGPLGITVNAVAPGPIRTRLSESWVPTREGEVAAGIPVKRIGETEDVAAAVLYLASREAGFVNGHTLVVDGGVTIAAAKNVV